MAQGTFDIGYKILGRYEVIGTLGEGGMGVVYRCLDLVSDTLVAVKGLSPKLSGDAAWMADVKRNFQVVAELRHSCIAGLRNLEQDETGAYYLVMDYVRGRDLPDYIAEHKLTLENTFILLTNVADALDYAHGEGVIHRDVKPDNVKIAVDGSVKLLDFGIAARLSSSGASACSGTPYYMAPEQWRGEKQSGATDEYALAAMAYEIVFGNVPFADKFGDGADNDLIARCALKEPVTFPKEAKAKVRAVFTRALAKDQKERYPTCRKFIRALAVAMGYEKVAKPRFGWLGWSLAAALFLAATGGAVFFLGEIDKRDEQVETKEARIVEISNDLRTIEDKLKNAEKLSEDERAKYLAERERLQAESKKLNGELKAKADRESETLWAQIEALKARLATIAATNAVREAKVKREPMVVPIEKPKLRERELRAAGVGFYTVSVPWDGNHDMFQNFSVWGNPARQYESCPRYANGRFNTVKPHYAHLYVSLMRFRAGVSYAFKSNVDDFGKVYVDGRLAHDQLLAQGTLPPVRFDDDGYHRLTLVVLDTVGKCGSFDNPTPGMLYRENDGDWKPFAATSEDSIFRLRAPGIDPIAKEKEYARKIKELKPGFVTCIGQYEYKEAAYNAFNVWGNPKRQDMADARPMMPMMNTMLLKEDETLICSTYMLLKPNVKYELYCDVDDCGWIFLDDAAVISNQRWQHPEIYEMVKVEKPEWHRLTFEIKNIWGYGGINTWGWSRERPRGLFYRENGGEWKPFVTDMEDVIFRRKVEGRDPIAEEKRAAAKCPRLRKMQRIRKASDLEKNEDFTFDMWFTPKKMVPGSRIFEFQFAEMKSDNQFSMSWADNGRAVVQCDRRRFNVEYTFKEGETYHLALAMLHQDANEARPRLYIAKADDLAFQFVNMNLWSFTLPWKKLSDILVGESKFVSVPKGDMKTWGPRIVNRHLIGPRLQRLHDRGAPKDVRESKAVDWTKAAVTNHFTVVARVTPKGRIENFPTQIGGGGTTLLDIKGPLLFQPAKPSVGNIAGVCAIVGTNGVIVVERNRDRHCSTIVAERKLPQKAITLALVYRGQEAPELYIDGKLAATGAKNTLAKFFNATACEGAKKGHDSAVPFVGEIHYVRAYNRPLGESEIPRY